MATRAREQDGFGLIELLIALFVLTVGLMALVAAFSSGIISIQRAGHISTASAIADKQMEGFRDLQFASIGLVAPLPTNAVYTGDVAYTSVSGAMTTVASCAGVSGLCTASQTVTGPDGRSYRVDTYVSDEVEGTRTLHKVTVVVRNPSNVTGTPYIREVTSFDAAFG